MTNTALRLEAQNRTFTRGLDETPSTPRTEGASTRTHHDLHGSSTTKVDAQTQAYARRLLQHDLRAGQLALRLQQQELPRESGDPIRGTYGIAHSSDEAGDYYCEHLFYELQENAASAGVLKDGNGERMVGFMHVPVNAADHDHAGTKDFLGAGIKGYFDEAADQVAVDEPVKIQVSGFEPWAGVPKNPSGDLLQDKRNIDAAMAEAFGDDLESAQGRVLENRGPGEYLLEYDVCDRRGRERKVHVRTDYLPVNDRATSDHDPRSLPHAMHEFQPHAVVSMGVNPNASSHGKWRVETLANDKDYDRSRSQRDRGNPGTGVIAYNNSLWNAMQEGHR